MTFNEMVLSVNNDFDFLDAFLGRANIFAESSFHEYEKNINQIEVRILTEAGTEDDKDELNKAASADFIERTKKFVAKLIDTIVTHIVNIGNNIGNFFSQAKVKLALKNIDEVIKNSKEKLANIKLKVFDVTAAQEFFEKRKADTLKHIAYLKAKGESAQESAINAFNDMVEKYEVDKKAEFAKAKVEKGVDDTKKLLGSLTDRVASVTTKAASDIKDATSNIDFAKYPAEISENLRKAISFLGKIVKDAADSLWKGINSCFDAIKSLGSKKDESEDSKEKEVGESELLSKEELKAIFTEAEVAINGKLFEERVSMTEVEEKYVNAMKSAADYATQAKNFVKDKKYAEAIKAYENEKKVIQEAIDAINSDTSGFTGALKGNIVYYFINLIPNLVFTMNKTVDVYTDAEGNVVGVNKGSKSKVIDLIEAIHNLNESVKDLRGVVEEFKKRGMTWDIFNTRKSTIIGKMKNYISLIDIEIKYLQKAKDVVKESVNDSIINEIDDIFDNLMNEKEESEFTQYDLSTPEGYLEAMEAELFSDNDEVTESEESTEDVKSSVDTYIDSLISNLK